jgi:two-component system, LytTR family, response regulator
MRCTVLIVDDEPLARAGLRTLLGRDPDIGVIHEAANGVLAVEAIRRERPDLVFLDVQMPDRDGFGVVADIGPDRMPATVFVTAHDEHAIQAFEINAVDYLLKPVTAERFAQALARAKARLAAAPAGEERRQMVEMLATLVAPPRHVQRLAVKASGRTVFVDVSDIDWIEAAENYVELHVPGASHLLHVPLSTLEKSLDPARFLRIHRSTIVRIQRIAELLPGAHGEFVVVLADGTRLDSGRTYADKLRALAANPF